MQLPTSSMRVAIVGATGLAGQQFVEALVGHPFFTMTGLFASQRSAGKTYSQALTSAEGKIAWHATSVLPSSVAQMMVGLASELDPTQYDVIFSAVETKAAQELEPLYAKHCPVISTASAFRYEQDTPILLFGANKAHIPMLKLQQKNRGFAGFIAPNPNCTVVGLAMTLAPLHKAFGVRKVHMVSMQAVSGAGRSPGVPSLDSIDNIVPYIPKEEYKVETEAKKILGTFDSASGKVTPADIAVSATCTRVGVLEGHTEVVHVELEKDVTEKQVVQAWEQAGVEALSENCPSAPASLIHVHTDPYRPQVRLDRDCGDGLTTVVGRLRKDDATPHGFKYVVVSHNTKMGAASGCILMAESLIQCGMIKSTATPS